jgi:PAS domain S-box-containing protein
VSGTDVAPSRVSELGSGIRRHLPALLLALVVATSVPLLLVADGAGGVPAAWPAVGLLTGVLLVGDPVRRGSLFALGTVLLVVVHLLVGIGPAIALGAAAASSAGAAATWWRLRRGLGERRPGLAEEGDVSRLIAAATVGSAVSASVTAVLAVLTQAGDPGLAALAVFATHAAAQLMLLPLFLDVPQFEALAPVRERVVQSVILLGATVALFSYASAPPLVFAVMPMFGWLAFRGTLREASLLLVGVGVVATGATVAGLGPVHELESRYALPPELVTGFLQLFLVDCALILLPLSVMATQQRMSAARASAGQQTLQRLVDAATGSAVIATDLDGVVQVFNPGAEAMFLRTAEDTIGAPADLLFADAELLRQAARMETRPIFAEICSAAVAAGDERQPWHFQRPDGELRSMVLTLTSVTDERGEAAGYVCVGEDVTEREAVHRALLAALERQEEAVERLTDLERVKADFVATVSHELRTPLTSMIGYLELLDDGEVGDLTDPQRALTGRVRRNSRRLLLLVEDLLLLSQIEARQMTLEPRPVDLRDCVTAALDSLASTLVLRELEVVSRLPHHPVTLQADPDQLERMLLNLVSNAVKFTPDGGRVELVVSETRDSVEVTVLDTGMGIPEAEQGQLFTRFFRASTANVQAIQGAGLGLTIVQAIVTAHAGQVAVSSSEGTGTTVAVSLPRTAPATPAAPDQSATPYRRSPASPSPGTM